MIERSVINRIPRFSGITEEAEAWLSERMTRRRHEKGAILFFEGDECSHFLLVEFGAVKVVKILESGRELILDIFRSGQAVGEVALLDGAGYPATAVVHQDATLLTMRRCDYFAYLRRFPEAPQAVIRDLTLRLRNLSRRVQEMGCGAVENRLARVLLTLAHRFGQKEESGLLIPLPVTRQDCADLIGARIETVIRVFSRWKREGLLSSSGKGILILEPERLRRLAEVET